MSTRTPHTQEPGAHDRYLQFRAARQHLNLKATVGVAAGSAAAPAGLSARPGAILPAQAAAAAPWAAVTPAPLSDPAGAAALLVIWSAEGGRSRPADQPALEWQGEEASMDGQEAEEAAEAAAAVEALCAGESSPVEAAAPLAGGPQLRTASWARLWPPLLP